MATRLRIWPQFGAVSSEHPTPEWNGGYNLLYIEGAVGFDLTKWRIQGALCSYAIQLPGGVHVNLYPTQYGMVRIYQLDENGDPVGQPTLLICDRPRTTFGPTLEEQSEELKDVVTIARTPTLSPGSKYIPPKG